MDLIDPVAIRKELTDPFLDRVKNEILPALDGILSARIEQASTSIDTAVGQVKDAIAAASGEVDDRLKQVDAMVTRLETLVAKFDGLAATTTLSFPKGSV